MFAHGSVDAYVNYKNPVLWYAACITLFPFLLILKNILNRSAFVDIR